MSELVIDQTDGGRARVQFRPLKGSLWLTQLHSAKLHGVTVANINIHLRKVVQDDEQAADGKR